MANIDLGTIPMGDRDGDTLIDPGAPQVHDRETPVEDKPAEKTAEQKRIEALEADLEKERKLRQESDENARFWAKRNKQPAPKADDDEPAPRRRVAPVEDKPEEKPEELLEDISASGLKALEKRGVITKDQLKEALEDLAERMTAAYRQDKDGDQFDENLRREFPELHADNERIDRGEKPKTELFQLTSRNFKQLCKDANIAPDSFESRGLMLAAARMAKKELEVDGTEGTRREETRRDRIERQGGGGSRRGRGGGEESDTGGGSRELTPLQATIVKNLGRYGATPDGFRKFAGKGGMPHGR